MDPTQAIPLMQILGGYYSVWMVHTAARLGLADHLKDGPLGVSALAEACQADPLSLARFLETLEGFGLVTRTTDARYALTAMGHWLRGDVAGSLKPSALMCGEEAFFRAWVRCTDAVRSGHPSFETANGASFFDFLDARPALLADFQAAMTSFPHLNAHILEAFDFGACRGVLDLGGGTGSLAKAVIDAHPAVRCGVLDRASVIAVHRQSGLADPRLEWIAGDFLEAIPPGADCHVLRFVLSDWPDDVVVRIFGHSYRALPEGGALLIVDNLQPEDVRPNPMAALDLMMLVVTGGQVRTAKAYVDLLVRAGFTHRRTVVTPSRTTVIVAQRPKSARD